MRAPGRPWAVSTSLELSNLEAPTIPPLQLETLIDLYDGSIAELERLGDPEVAELIWRLERRRAWTRELLARHHAAQ
jgi:hypothetical protein